MLLSDTTADATRLALVGLAKNTGKTVALGAILAELAAGGRTVGVTSVGRDGEEHDVIDSRIEKPRVELRSGSLVATTDSLLRASGIPSETLSRTGVRTPLGEVLIARLKGAGVIEIAGPSAAADVRAASDTMLAAGAEQVLIDGAIDRRAASSPDVADGLVMATGAILAPTIEEVVERTRDAVELVRLPGLEETGEAGAHVGELARARPRADVLVGAEAVELAPRTILTASETDVAGLLAAHPDAGWLIVAGALPEAFAAHLAHAARRERRRITVVVGDPTRAFLSERSVDHYRRAGVELRALRGIELLALTVNPVAPQSHVLDSGRLRALLAEEIEDVPIFDVLHPSYEGSLPAAPR